MRERERCERVIEIGKSYGDRRSRGEEFYGGNARFSNAERRETKGFAACLATSTPIKRSPSFR